MSTFWIETCGCPASKTVVKVDGISSLRPTNRFSVLQIVFRASQLLVLGRCCHIVIDFPLRGKRITRPKFIPLLCDFTLSLASVHVMTYSVSGYWLVEYCNAGHSEPL